MGKNYTHILLDLDGTITDSMPGITRSVQYALEHMGIHVEDTNTLRRFIGPPLRDSFRDYYHFNDAQTSVALAQYRERYEEKGMFESQVYNGIPALLEELRNGGKTIMLATSKPEVYAKQILEHFGIHSYFSFVGGADLEGRRDHKADVLRHVLAHFPEIDPENMVMVGDRHHDIDGAKALQIDAIGVLYGYGNLPELQKAGATYIAKDVEDLKRLLLNN